MQQDTYEDPYGFEVWDLRKSQRCFVTIANAEPWMDITGEEPPTSPISASAYTQAGLPWFEYYADDQTAIKGAKRLGKIKSIKNVPPTAGQNIWVSKYSEMMLPLPRKLKFLGV